MLLLYVPRALFLVPVVAIGFVLLLAGQWRLLWTQALRALVLVWPLMGLRVSLPHRDPGPSLRLLTYNVWAGGLGAEAIRRQVLEAHPDLVLFQATTQAADDAFRDPAFRGWSVRRAGPYSIPARYLGRAVVGATPAPPPARARFPRPLAR